MRVLCVFVYVLLPDCAYFFFSVFFSSVFIDLKARPLGLFTHELLQIVSLPSRLTRLLGKVLFQAAG